MDFSPLVRPRHISIYVRPIQPELNWSFWRWLDAYLLEMDLTQISTHHETSFIICHVEFHIDFSSMIISLDFRPSLFNVK
jgi:hypothetical protein